MGGDDAHRVYGKRWLMLLFIALNNFSNGMNWISFAAIANTTSEAYSISLDWVNVLSLVFMVLYLPIGFVSSWCLGKFGIRLTVSVGVFLNIAGAFLRYASIFLAPPNPYLLFLGQILCAVAQPFFLNVPPMLASLWFSVETRAIADTLGTVANILGIGAAQVVSPLMGLSTSLLFYTIASIVAGMPTVMFLKSRPPTPPSSSSEEALTQTDFWADLKQIAKIPVFWVLFVTFGIGLAAFNTLSTLLGQTVVPLGYTEDDAGFMGMAMIASGLVSAGVAAPLLDHTHKYREFFVGAFALGATAAMLFVFAARPGSIVFMYVTVSLFGFGAFALLPSVLELGVEVTYPISEGTSTGLLYMSGQAFAVVMLLLSSVFRDPVTERMDGALWMVGISGVCAFLLSLTLFWPLRPEYKRLRAERRGGLEER